MTNGYRVKGVRLKVGLGSVRHGCDADRRSGTRGKGFGSQRLDRADVGRKRVGACQALEAPHSCLNVSGQTPRMPPFAGPDFGGFSSPALHGFIGALRTSLV